MSASGIRASIPEIAVVVASSLLFLARLGSESVISACKVNSLPGLPDSQLIALLSETSARLGILSMDKAEQAVSDAIAKSMAATSM